MWSSHYLEDQSPHIEDSSSESSVFCRGLRIVTGLAQRLMVVLSPEQFGIPSVRLNVVGDLCGDAAGDAPRVPAETEAGVDAPVAPAVKGARSLLALLATMVKAGTA